MEPSVRRLLTEGRNFCHLVTRKADGEPRAVVLWIDAEGEDTVLLNGSEGQRAWLEDVRRDPRVICTVINMNDPYEYVRIEGHVVDDTHEGANDHIHKLSERYRGRRYSLRDGEQRVLVRVAPDRVRHRSS